MILSPLPLSAEDFEFFRRCLFEKAGISLSDAKKSLIQCRLRSRATALGDGGFEAYRAHLESLPPGHPEWQEFVNMLTTNKTEWFREPEHFNHVIHSFLPAWKTRKRKHLRVWCAASSTGEEPYSLALILASELWPSGLSFEITATDIDTRVLAQARNGVYPRQDLSRIPAAYHELGFDAGRNELSSWIRVKNSLKEQVHFETLNLTAGAYPWTDCFDLIFCRNVLIYFNRKTVAGVIRAAFETARADSALYIAHAESLQNVISPWHYVRPSIYQKGRAFWPHFAEAGV